MLNHGWRLERDRKKRAETRLIADTTAQLNATEYDDAVLHIIVEFLRKTPFDAPSMIDPLKRCLEAQDAFLSAAELAKTKAIPAFNRDWETARTPILKQSEKEGLALLDELQSHFQVWRQHQAAIRGASRLAVVDVSLAPIPAFEILRPS